MNRKRHISRIRLMLFIRKIRRNRRKVVLISLLTLITLLPIAVFLLRSGNLAEAGWWPDGGAWEKRKQLTILYASPVENLDSGATISITVNTKLLVSGGKLRSDCADLRIIYQPNDTAFTDIPRHLIYSEGTNCASSEATKVFFKLQAQLNTTSQTSDYYLYYGNLQATAAEISVDVFDTSVQAKFTCQFNSTARCVNESGAVEATNVSGALRYSGAKSALSFDGFNDFFNGGSASIIDNIGAFTVELWVYPKKLGSNTQTFIQKGTETNRWVVQTLDTDKIRFYIDYGTQDLIVDSGSVLTEDEWQHIAVVWDGNANADNTIIYRNGVDVSATRTNSSGSRANDGAGNLIIGAGVSAEYFYGLIDEARLSRGARYISEFTPSSAPLVSDPATLALYHFDENGFDSRNSNRAWDSSFILNHGTITGAKFVAGLIGIDDGLTDTGLIAQQGYSSREGVFIESGTTNKIPNPSFEHATYNTNWTASGGTASENTDIAYVKFGNKSYKLALSDATDRTVLTSVNAGNTNTHTLSAYIYRGTTGNVGGTVDATVVQLVFNGSAQTTTYTDMGGGWWRLSYSGSGVASAVDYGIQVNEDSGTLYIDGVQLEEKAYASTYADGNLGNAYSWSSTANESTSTRTGAYIEYPASGNISAANGSISMWARRNSAGDNPTLFNWQDSTGDNYLRLQCSGTTCTFSKRVGGGSVATLNRTVNFGVETWVYLVATWDSTNGMAFYADNSSTTGANTNTPTGLNSTYTIGSTNSANSANAYINDLRIFNNPLTSGEIADIYYAGLITQTQGYEVDRFSSNKGEDPIARWNFDDGYGQTARDSSNNGYDFTLGSTASVSSDDPVWKDEAYCVRGSCLNFDGSGQHLKLGGLLGRPPSLTISAWIKLIEVDSSGSDVISLGDSVLIRISSSFASFYDGTAWRTTEYSHNFNDGKWHYITYTIDDTNDIQKFYIDGTEAASSAYTGSINYATQGTDTYIGKHGNGGTDFDFNGFIDEVKVYSYPRTREQILVDFNSGAVTFGLDRPPFLVDGLVGHWKLDEGTGTNYADSSGYGNHMSTQAAPTWTTGKFGHGLDFENEEMSNIRILDNSTLSITGDLTVSGWIKPESVTADTMFTITGKWDEDEEAYLLSQFEDEIRFSISDPGIYVTTTDAGLTPGSWYQVTAIYEAKTSIVRIYVNGTEKAITTTGTIPGSIPDTASAYYIGAYPEPGTGGGNTYSSQPTEANMIDTFVREDAADTANPTSTTISTFANATQRRSGLLKFDLSSIPSGSTITGATLYLYAAAGTSGTRSFSAARILAANSGWVEGATWNYANPSTVRWAGDTGNNGGSDAGGSVSGTDYSSTALGTASLTNFSADAEFAFTLNLDETLSMVENNYGIYITRTDANTAFALHSSSATTATVRPKLVINYTSGTTLFDSYDGVIDEVRVYNRSLSPAEVKALYEWAPGPKAYYTFEEGSGTGANAVKDRSGNAYHGTMQASMTDANWVPGKYGKAMSFDGVDDQISLSNPLTNNLQYPFTISAWFYMEPGFTGNKIIYGERADTAPSEYLQVRVSENSVMYQIYDSDGGQPAVIVWADYRGAWHHISAVSRSENDHELFIDGVSMGTNSVTATQSEPYTKATIGALSSAAGGYFNFWPGKIDELKVYNYARTPQQIVEDMNAGHPVPGSPVGSAYIHYKLDEGSGTTANNAGNGGSARNGSITSGSWSNQGKFGSAVTFTASTSITATIADPGNTNTLSVWVYPTTSAASKTLVTSGKLTTDSSSRPVYGGCTGTALAVDTWAHISAVSNGSGSCTIYQNGLKTATGTTGVTFGTSLNLGGSSFTGRMDDFRMYTSALTESQIAAVMNGGFAQAMGAISTDSTGEGSNAAGNAYCPPGQSSACVGPIGEWLFDENTGSTANDSSGNGNTGTLTDSNNGSMGSNVWEPGKFGSAIRFDGVNDQVSTNNGNSVKGLTAYTLEAWVKPSVLDGVRRTIYDEAVNTSTNSRIKLTIDTDNRFLFAGRDADAGTFTNWVDSTTTLSADTWYHVVAVFDSVTDVHRLYLNGQLQTGSVAAAAVSNTNPNYTPRIGGRGVLGQEEPFKGLIDTVRVYNYARTEEQVMWTFNQGAPVGWWKFDECSGTSANDSSGNGKTGTITSGSGTIGTCSGSTGDMWKDGAAGKSRASLAFNSSESEFVNVGNTGYTSIRAVSFWAKPSSTTQKILQISATDTVEISSGTVVVGGFGTETIYVDGKQTSVFPDTNWHHVTILSSSDITANVMDIGRMSSTYYSGQIDDVRIYNYALSPAQIRTVMNEGGAVRFGP